jgi:transformation/transcription domain-associated protein
MLDIKAKVAIISEIRDSVDLYRDTADITRFIGVVVPVAIQILRTGQPIFRKDAPEQVWVPRVSIVPKTQLSSPRLSAMQL